MPTRFLLFFLAFSISSCFSNKRHQGQDLYVQHCAGCHGDQGQGLARLIPPLAGSDYLAAHRAELPCLLSHGMNHAIVVNGIAYQGVMPGNDSLNNPARMTNLLNYLENRWGNHARPRTISAVDTALQACP